MNSRGARILINDTVEGRVWEVDPHIQRKTYTEGSAGGGTYTFVAPDEAALVEEINSTVPSVVRRTPRERYEATLKKVITEVVESYRVTGRARWPRSAELALAEQAKIENDPTLLSDGGIEQVIRQGKAITRYVVRTGENRQREQDGKKVTLGWSGH